MVLWVTGEGGLRAAGVVLVLGTRPVVGDTVSSLVSGNITGEGGALSMLELAEGTIWGSRTVLKTANCVFLCSVHKAEEGQYSMERYSHRSA